MVLSFELYGVETMRTKMDQQAEEFRSWQQKHEETFRSIERSLARITQILEARQRPSVPATVVVSPTAGPLMTSNEPPMLAPPRRSIRLEFPKFDSMEVRQWISTAEEFFSYYMVTDPYLLRIAAIYLDELPWFQKFQKSGSVSSWSSLKQAILAAESQLASATKEALFASNGNDAALEVFDGMPKRVVEVDLELLEEMPELEHRTAERLEEKARIQHTDKLVMMQVQAMSSASQAPDIQLFDNENEKGADAWTSKLNDELIHVDIVLSDTTGPLHCNQLTSLKCSIAAVSKTHELVIEEPAESRERDDKAAGWGNKQVSGSLQYNDSHVVLGIALAQLDTYGWFDKLLGSHRLLAVLDRRMLSIGTR